MYMTEIPPDAEWYQNELLQYIQNWLPFPAYADFELSFEKVRENVQSQKISLSRRETYSEELVLKIKTEYDWDSYTYTPGCRRMVPK